MTQFLGPQPEPGNHLQHRTILEIGTGRNEGDTGDGVLWQPTIERLVLGPEDRYIGLEIGARYNTSNGQQKVAERDQAMRSEWAARIETDKHRIGFVQARGEQLPFATGTMSQVIMNNLFTFGTIPETRGQLMLEADRVLTDDGLLIVHDDYTPKHYELPSMLHELHLSGLDADLDRIVNRSKPQDEVVYQEFRDEFGFPDKSTPYFSNASLWLFHKGALRPRPVQPRQDLAYLPEMPDDDLDILLRTVSNAWKRLKSHFRR